MLYPSKWEQLSRLSYIHGHEPENCQYPCWIKFVSNSNRHLSGLAKPTARGPCNNLTTRVTSGHWPVDPE